jgi:large subunit ribosomal protein L1|uniref:Large ribosomal subunit protein uL1 n=1 Tax=Caldisericum exile TaxID=693075 RepID=A0A7C4XZT6_9BACT
MKRGKRYLELLKKIDRQKAYSVDEAIETVKTLKSTKFDETVEVAYVLNVDPKQADQNVRGVITLPHGTGKSVRVLVFATTDKAQEAKDAGADYVGGEDLIQKIEKEGFLDFDVAIATPDIMKSLGRIAKILGPRKLMPSPKSGTVTMDIYDTVKEFKAGKIEFRVDKTGVIHTVIGKSSFPKEQIKENLLALNSAVVKSRPASVRGQYVKKVYLSLTMSPAIKLNVNELLRV